MYLLTYWFVSGHLLNPFSVATFASLISAFSLEKLRNENKIMSKKVFIECWSYFHSVKGFKGGNSPLQTLNVIHQIIERLQAIEILSTHLTSAESSLFVAD